MFSKFLLILTLLTARVEAGDLPSSSKTPPSKSKFNTQIYERESDTSSFTDTVKTIRPVAEQSQVFFVTQKGAYFLETSLDSGRAQNLLAMSQKKNLPVNITANKDTKQILKVSVGATESIPE